MTTELDRMASLRAVTVMWFMFALVCGVASMSRDVGFRAGQLHSDVAVEPDPQDNPDRMARTWIGLMNYHAKRLENR